MKLSQVHGPGLASKLLLTSVALLAIPWLGYKTLQATRDFLFQGQAQAQLLSADAVAKLFHNRSDLLDVSVTGVPELPLYQLQGRILLDGLNEDWDLLAPQRQLFAGDSISFELLLGRRQQQLYALVEVRDTTPVHRHPGYSRLNHSDHLRLYLRDSNGTQQRLQLSFEGSGAIIAHEMDKQWRYPLDPGASHLVHGFVTRDQSSYVLEFSLPLDLLGEPRLLGLEVADVSDNQGRRVTELLRSLPAGHSGHYSHLVERSVQAERLLQALAPRHSRIWIVDRLGHVKASRGQLETTAPADTDKALDWAGLLQALQDMVSKWLLGIPLGPTRDFDADTTPSREDALLREALQGRVSVARRSAVNSKGEIIAAAQPIFDRGEIIGAVLVEKSTRQILSLQRQAIERLALLSLLTVLVVALALLGFAARLTYRIRRLDKQAQQAIDNHGRLSEQRIHDELYAGDEIGELARSFNAMLEKLHGHQQFLAAIPRTLRHEINNPLNTISTSLEQLEAQHRSSDTQLAAARRALQRIGMLVENLSETASLEQALKTEHSVDFDFRKLLQDYARNRQRRPPSPKLEITVPSQAVVVNGSDLHIEQLLDKLIDNAIDFAVPGSAIRIDLTIANQHCRLRVCNSGATIASDQLNTIFQLMHSIRDGNTKSRHFGLGLYVAQLIARFHGGSICAENLEDSSGVVFTVVLPCK